MSYSDHSLLKTAVIGITRDNESCISQGIKNMIKISNIFKDSIVYLYENDSTDTTPKILAEWKAQFPKKFYYTSEKNVSNYSYHTQNIAQARQKALDWVRRNYSKFDLLIIIDPDLYYDINIYGIFNTLNNWDKWDVCFANGIYNKQGMTWDAFAMRLNDQNTPWDGNKHYWSNFHKKNGWGTGRVITDWTEVKSAFGGIGIYKSEFISGVNYDINNIDCEHIAFHNKILKKRIFLNINEDVRKGSTVIYAKGNFINKAIIKDIHTDDCPNLYYTIQFIGNHTYEKQTTSDHLYLLHTPKLYINPQMTRIYSIREIGNRGGYGRPSFR